MGKWREAEARKDLADQVAFGGASLVAMRGPEVIGIVAVLRDWIMPVSGFAAFHLPRQAAFAVPFRRRLMCQRMARKVMLAGSKPCRA
jgi:hypothetical protein